MPWLPRKIFHDWPDDAVALSKDKVQQMYESGFAGCKHDEKVVEDFNSAFNANGEALAYEYKLQDTGAGKLVIPFVYVLEAFPGCSPGPAQERGDCVSHSTKNAALTTMVGDVLSDQPDEKTGEIEGIPEVPEAGIKQGVLSTETFYWWRGYSGDGWMCHAAAMVAVQKSGLFIRQNYPELGVDLTSYSGQKAGLYGSRTPPDNILKVGQAHLLHDLTEVATFAALRDYLYNFYGVSSCGGEGYASTRDKYGVSKRTTSWAHAMAIWGVDDRADIITIFGEPLVLIMNSWGIWNGGPRDIFKSAELVPKDKKELWTKLGIVNAQTGNIMIPEGSFWTPWSHCKFREYIVHSGAVGFKRRQLLDYGTKVWG